MSLPRLFVTRALPGDVLRSLEGRVEVQVWPGELPPGPEVLRQTVGEVDGILTLLTDRVDRALLERAPNLRVVSNMAVGVDNVDLAACTARRIPVGHTPGVLTETTADFAFALLLSAARRLVEGDRFVREGRWKTWSPTLLLGRDVHGGTLGIVGMGAIGRAVAQRAHGFGMRVLYTSPRPSPEVEERFEAKRLPLTTLLASADFVSLHAPLKADTRHLIGAAELALMKPSAILINTARGELVNPTALYEGLCQGRPAAAALDVTDPEPISPADPLLSLPNVVFAPHLGSASLATRTLMAKMAVENAWAGLSGQRLPHCANQAALHAT